MKIFTLEGGRPTITPEALTIQAFKRIWNRDRSQSKERAMEELAYVYFMEYFDSPYEVYNEVEKPLVVAKEVCRSTKLKDFDHDDPLITGARQTYVDLQETIILSVYRSYVNALQRIKESADNIDFSDDADGKKTKMFFDNMKKFSDSITVMASLKQQIVKEQTSKLRVKGGTEVSNREKHPNDR